MNMNSGYVGWSRSRRAAIAESEGKLPASRLAKLLRVPTCAVHDVLEPCEWHHTSKFCNRTNYYDGTALFIAAGIWELDEAESNSDDFYQLDDAEKIEAIAAAHRQLGLMRRERYR